MREHSPHCDSMCSSNPVCTCGAEASNEFEKAVTPVVEYLHKHGHPHMTVIVTQTSAELVEGKIGLPFEPLD